MGIHAVYSKPKTTKKNLEHKIYPYLLRNMTIDHANQVWCTDITYIPLARGLMYLAAVMDWKKRYHDTDNLKYSIPTNALNLQMKNSPRS